MLNGLHSSHGPGAPDDELNVRDLLPRVRTWSVGSDGNTNRGIAARYAAYRDRKELAR